MSIFPDLKAQVRARLVPHYKVSDISRRARCGLYQCIINHIIIRPNKIWCKSLGVSDFGEFLPIFDILFVKVVKISLLRLGDWFLLYQLGKNIDPLVFR